jgi:beta-hydroxylase
MIKWFILALFVVTGAYVHYRGRVRHKFFRQALDHSTFFAPLNTFMYAFSTVPNTPYIDMAQFPQLQVLKDHWQEIRAEAVALFGDGKIKPSAQYNDAGFNSFFKTGWGRFYLKWYDEPQPSALEFCPYTTQLVRDIPGVKAVLFASLPPGARLPRHRDPYSGSLRFHMGLITPNDPACFIEVDGERYHWRDGEAVMFDETFIHYAENATEQNRIILFADIERPMKYRWTQAVNRFFGGLLLRSATSPNEAGDRTGGINRIFGAVYAVRKLGKRLKQYNKTLYYIVKWAIVVAILAWIFL